MRQLGIFAVLLSLSAAASASQTIATADEYRAVAWFTSGLVNGEPVDRIDTASLGQDYIYLYVDWDEMRARAYRTEVRIVDPNGRTVDSIRNIILPGSGRYRTYYYYRPGPGDIPGDWTYQMLVDGRNAFDARIRVVAAQ